MTKAKKNLLPNQVTTNYLISISNGITNQPNCSQTVLNSTVDIYSTPERIQRYRKNRRRANTKKHCRATVVVAQLLHEGRDPHRITRRFPAATGGHKSNSLSQWHAMSRASTIAVFLFEDITIMSFILNYSSYTNWTSFPVGINNGRRELILINGNFSITRFD